MGAEFACERYNLDGGVTLRSLEDDRLAASLGTCFASIEPWCRYDMSGSALHRYFTQNAPHQRRFSILWGEEVAGIIVIQPHWLRGPYVPFFGVLPVHQSKEIGSRTLAFVADEARRCAERNTWIAVSDFNLRARTVYERAGYIAVAEIPGLVADAHTEILMRKRL